ncbi:MAG: hypothetical protein WBV46_13220 [Terriglobales bacterium]|jgi:hypothetical protein
MKQTIRFSQIARIAIAAAILGVASLSTAFAQAANDAEARNQENWREAIARTEVPAAGCFHASYPSLTWDKVECSVAPNIPYRPRTGRISQTVGDGNDYAAEVSSGLISKTTGSFPKVKGVTTETGLLGPNDYSLQLNSNFMNTAACNGAKNPAECLDWEQFVYSSGYEQAFMQYWLINYNNRCPGGWYSYGGDCYTNSASVGTAEAVITELKTLKLSGSAKAGTAKKAGIDTLVFTAEKQAYSTTGLDTVVDLATAWTESEFNIVGDGDGSEASFNSGSSVTVKVAVSNGTKNAPTCASNAGTTAETNNLNLGSCSGAGAATPFIEFTESN